MSFVEIHPFFCFPVEFQISAHQFRVDWLLVNENIHFLHSITTLHSVHTEITKESKMLILKQDFCERFSFNDRKRDILEKKVELQNLF